MKWYIWGLIGCLIFTGCSQTKYTIIEENITNKEQTLDESQVEVESEFIEAPITMKKVDYSEYFRVALHAISRCKQIGGKYAITTAKVYTRSRTYRFYE